MKILFLDMDGVLNSEESFVLNHAARSEEAFKRGENAAFAPQYLWPLGHIYEPLVERLNQIVEQTNCDIVVSSSWRIRTSPQELGVYLKLKGFRHSHKLIDRTGKDSVNARGGEIQQWLDEHPGVVSYVILDDDTADIIGDYTTKKHPNNFVHTPFMYGLQDEHVTQAVNILNKKNVQTP